MRKWIKVLMIIFAVLIVISIVLYGVWVFVLLPKTMIPDGPSPEDELRSKTITELRKGEDKLILYGDGYIYNQTNELNAKQGMQSDFYSGMKNLLSLDNVTFNIGVLCYGAEYKVIPGEFSNKDLIIKYFKESRLLYKDEIDIQRFLVTASETAELKEWPCEFILSHNGTEYAKESFTITVEAAE